jgi:broad specificity phosphatase PhoE
VTGSDQRRGELWLVRHGETEWSRASRHTGRTDVPLTPYGEEQAVALAPLLGGLHPALVLSSPRQRAWRTAELAGLAPVSIDDDLAEWDYGEYEGLTTGQIRRDRPGWTIWTGDPPAGETAAQVAARADGVLGRLQDALSDGDVVVIAHGHIGRVLAARWLGLEPSAGRLFMLEPACPSVLGTEHGSPVIHRWNLPNPAAADLADSSGTPGAGTAPRAGDGLRAGPPPG